MGTCLYTLIDAPPERNESILQDVVHPIVDRIKDSPHLESLFFVRMSEPRWQLRFRIVGAERWVSREVRSDLCRLLDPLEKQASIDGYGFTSYEREVERYGGEEGMRGAEELFTQDSLACLQLIEADQKGLLETSRREFNLVLTHRFLDLMEFDRRTRLVFYRHGYSWATEDGTWQENELQILEERFENLRDGLLELFSSDHSRDANRLWGGEEPRRIGEAFLEAARPVVGRILEGHREERIRQDIVYLAWSYTHMMCNRMGIHSVAEAILRYFMHRLLTETAAVS